MISSSEYSESNWISRVFFWWIFPLVQLGNRKELNASDIYKLPSNNSAEQLGNMVGKYWEKEFIGRNPKLSRAIYKSFGLEFVLITLLFGFRELVCRLGQVYCLLLILGSLEGSYSIQTGNIASCMLLFLLLLNTCTTQLSEFKTLELSMKIRVSLTTMIYRKVLRLPLGVSNLGQVSNLISNDLARFERYMLGVPFIFIAPVQFIIVAWLLWSRFGVAALGGLSLVLLLFPSYFMIGRFFWKLRREMALKTDHRVRLTNELIRGIQYIKMSTWEDAFSNIIGKARKEELKLCCKRHRISFTNLAVIELIMNLTQFLIILLYVLSGRALTSLQVFMMSTALNLVRSNFVNNLQWAINGYFECLATFQRVQIFLLLSEKENARTIPYETSLPSLPVGGAKLVKVSRLGISWSSKFELLLSDVSLELAKEQLVAIIGPVGSGKSSILNAVLGEIPSATGTVILGTQSVAYVSQDPWVFPGTLLENILFGLPYREEWFSKVVEACALEPDIAQMPHGIAEMLGDRGISVSGGQKSRINLARAVYADEDLYLLDDPLSGVDANVADIIMSKCVRGLLRLKGVIMVIHQVQHLQFANEIIVLKHGGVDKRGTYDEVMVGSLSNLGLKEAAVDVIALDNNGNDNGNLTNTLSQVQEKLVTGKTYGTFANSKGIEIEETHSSGSTKLSLHWDYWSASGLCGAGSVILLFLATQVMDSSTSYLLKIWSHDDDVKNGSTQPYSHTYLLLYVILTVGFGMASLIRNLIFVQVGVNISKILHNRLLKSLIRAPMSFYQINNPGRVLNRVVFDIGVMDDYMLPWYRVPITALMQGIGFIVLIGVAYPLLFVPVLPLFAVFYKIRQFYITSGSTLKRIESLARSPLIGIFSSTLSGLPTIRASKSQHSMVQQFFKFQDAHSAAFLCYFGAAKLYSFLLDLATTTYVFIPIIYCMTLENCGDSMITDAAAVGLVLSSALSLSSVFASVSSTSTILENGMVSVERIFEYSNITSEAQLRLPDRSLPMSWPSNGKLEMTNVSLQYGTNQPVLHEINCIIKSNAKVGVVGRTGAGKSSLISALFRLEELCQGSVHLDSINISKIGLHDIRSNIFNIPQNPMLFLGSLRANLDPLERFTDDCLWKAISDVELANRFSASGCKGLDTEISDEGKNLSPGERQLLCLARALVEKTRILVLDEATAHVDNKTDAIVQRTIREKFQKQTVITIAHRLSTVIDNDKIMLLDRGKILEYDHPHILLQNQNGYLFKLCQKTGTYMNARLHQMAKTSFNRAALNVKPD